MPRRGAIAVTRFAIYARYSSDRQNESSCKDQITLCRAYGERRGWTFSVSYADAAISGASTQGREDFARMVADAESGHFDIILAEDVDRLSRNLGDIERFRERMEYVGVLIHTVADGEVSQISATIKGLTGAIFLKGHSQRMRGRMAEIARKGLSAGGSTYGYAPGETKGQRVIVETEADVVRRIFAEYLADRSPRDIAARLNADGIKPPRGSDWLASTINGNMTRGSGILGNTLYDGRLIYNRVSMRKAPGSNRRVSRPNPESEWITVEVPQLRIVDAKTFSAVRATKLERGKMRPEQSKRPKHLLAGLLRCGSCGAAMAVNNSNTGTRRIYCGRRKEGGRCVNGHTYRLDLIEKRVVDGLAALLKDPRAIERYLATYRAERKRLAAAEAGKRIAAEKSLGEIKREIDRLIDAVASGTLRDADVKSRMDGLRHRKETAEAELASLPAEPKVVSLHPATVQKYLASVEDLAGTLARRMVQGHEGIAVALRDLVDSVRVSPADKGDPLIEVAGRLATLTGDKKMMPHGALSQTLVAGSRSSRSELNDRGLYRFAA